MGPWLGVALAAALAATPRARATPARPPSPADERTASVESVLRDRMERLNKDYGALFELRNSYSLDVDLESAAVRRATLRARMESSLLELEDLHRQYALAAQESQVVKLQEGLMQLRRKLRGQRAHASAGILEETARAADLDAHVRSFRGRILDLLAAEEAAYRLAAQTHRQRSRLIQTAVAMALLFAGASALLAWRWRRVASYRPDPDAPPAPRLAGSEWAPGAVVAGLYRIERELGRGGMGLVYAATDLRLQRTVAIKRMLDAVASDLRGREQFLNEAHLVAQLRHPNIVEIHSVVEEPSGLYLVFEYVRGEPLERRSAARARLPLEAIKSVLRQTAAALDFAHARHVIHRDLKPSNIMVTEAGQVKVMDFGIAYVAKNTVARVTQASVVGTPPYMAPEAEVGEVSASGDLYSLGVVLYELVTGRLPFAGPNFITQKREMRLVPPSRLVEAAPEGLDALFARALAADPQRRFRSAAEIAGALDAL